MWFPEPVRAGSSGVPLEAMHPLVDQTTWDCAQRLCKSPVYRQILAEFVLPNAAEAVAQSPYWESRFGGPVEVALGTLKAHGLLTEPTNPHARMCHERQESDLRALCAKCGLESTGGVEQLAGRLLSIDPSGWLLGYPGEFLQCSELAVRAVRLASGEVQVEWVMLKRHAQQTAREGKLARCRDVHLAMANYLLGRNKRKKALQALCIVCAFDLCGARNRAPEADSSFDANRASLAPWLVERLSALSRDMALSMEAIREIFIGVASRLPVPQDAFTLWGLLQPALEGVSKHHEVGCSRVQSQ
jgi:hypothetical protein